MKTQIQTPAGPIKIISFKEFIDLIPVKEYDRNVGYATYFQRKSYSSSTYGTWHSDIRDTRVNVSFQKSVLWVDFTGPTNISEVPKRNLTEMAIDITTESVKNMGRPTHLVRLAKRIWLAVDPTDFEIHCSDLGTFWPRYAVANLKPGNSICWLVYHEEKT